MHKSWENNLRIFEVLYKSSADLSSEDAEISSWSHCKLQFVTPYLF